MTATIWSKTYGQGDDLVLIHGWGMNASVWDAVLPELSEHYRVTVLDLPGHGRSASLAFDGLESLSSPLLDVLPETATLLGWSMGGLAALWLAARFPARFRHVLLVGSSPSFVVREDWQQALDPEVFTEFAEGLEKDYAGTLRRFLALQLMGANNARVLARSLTSGLEAMPPDKKALIQGLVLLRQEDLRPLVCKDGFAVSVLLGERDTLAPGRLQDDLAGLCSGIEVEVLKGAGHMPFITHRDQFCSWVGRHHV
jgi:pimeloyl-[acyl-carrier protein] methyl ester esterase